MLEALKRRGMKAEGVRDLHVYHLVDAKPRTLDTGTGTSSR